MYRNSESLPAENQMEVPLKRVRMPAHEVSGI